MRISRLSVLLIILMTCAAGLSACGDSTDGTNNANNSGDNGNNTGNLPDCDVDSADVLDDDVDGEDVTLGQCILVTERVAIGNNGSLTIEPGSTVLFEQNTGFWITGDGVLNAAGTSSEPILFTGTEKQPGFWRNVYFENSRSADNILEHVTMEYAGSEDRPALRIMGRATVNARNNTIRNSAAAGFSLEQSVDSVPLLVFENNTVTENALAGISNPRVASFIDASNDLSGNTVDRVEIESIGAAAEIENSSPTYHNIGIPFLFKSDFKVFRGGIWTVEPGVEILMDANTRIVIGHDGVFVVDGTSEAPITIRGKEAAAGYWGDIFVEGSSSPSNLLRHVVIQDGGGGGAAEAATLNLRAGSDSTLRLELDQVTIRDSGNHGIYGDANVDGELAVSGCDTLTFEGIAGDDFAGDPVCSQ